MLAISSNIDFFLEEGEKFLVFEGNESRKVEKVEFIESNIERLKKEVNDIYGMPIGKWLSGWSAKLGKYHVTENFALITLASV